MHTRAHLGRVADPRATSRLDALLDDVEKATVHRPRPGDWGKYRQQSRWKPILGRTVKEPLAK